MSETNDKPFDVEQAFREAQTELRHMGAGVPGTINVTYLCQVAEGARRRGEPIVSAVIDDVSGCVQNPTEAMIFALGMLFASKLIEGSSEKPEAAEVAGL